MALGPALRQQRTNPYGMGTFAKKLPAQAAAPARIAARSSAMPRPFSALVT